MADRPWYVSAFDEHYLVRYAHRDESEARLAAQLFARYLPQGRDTGVSPVSLTAPIIFDLCCGAGRHLAALQSLGIHAMGGDLSAALLAAAHTRLPAHPVVRLDMRHLPLRDGSVDAVTNFFTAFGYFDEDAENFAVFTEVARVLCPGGLFFFDFLNAHRVRRELAAQSSSSTPHVDSKGRSWHIEKSLSSDGRRAEKTQRCVATGDVIAESVRLFSPGELSDALAAGGFTVHVVHGDYEGAPFVAESSPRFIVIARTPLRV